MSYIEVRIPEEFLIEESCGVFKFLYRDLAEKKGYKIHWTSKRGVHWVDWLITKGDEQEAINYVRRNAKSIKRSIIKNARLIMKEIYRANKKELRATLDFYLITTVFELQETESLSETKRVLNKLDNEFRTNKFKSLYEKTIRKKIKMLNFKEVLNDILN